jgi:UDP-glucuronate decarboxylase
VINKSKSFCNFFQKQRQLDITLAKERLGWEPKVRLKEGLVKTIEYFRGDLEL